jgi:hypothetical protein
VKSVTVTVDTNILDEDKLACIKEAATGLPIEFSLVTVTERERPGSAAALQVKSTLLETMVWDESDWDSCTWGGPIPETTVIGEWPLGQAVLGAEGEKDLLESVLQVISNGSFPKVGDRDNLTAGQRRQLRDAMILEAHVREQHDILLSDDTRAFGGDGSDLRAKLEYLCGTRIMGADEFCAYCESLRG